MPGFKQRFARIVERIIAPLDRLWLKFAGKKPKEAEKPILCDHCKYNYGNACKKPERPNATSCTDYKPR